MTFLSRRPRRVTKTYGRGSMLGFLSPVLAYVMAAAGMRGWEEIARRDMEQDVTRMVERGYRVTASDEYRLPAFGIVYYRVTYERVEPAKG